MPKTPETSFPRPDALPEKREQQFEELDLSLSLTVNRNLYQRRDPHSPSRGLEDKDYEGELNTLLSVLANALHAHRDALERVKDPTHKIMYFGQPSEEERQRLIMHNEQAIRNLESLREKIIAAVEE